MLYRLLNFGGNMKGRYGFISVMALIVMSVVIFMVLYLGHKAILQYLILSSTSNNTQSYYLAEAKIFMAVSEGKYYNDQLYPGLLEYFRLYPYSRGPGNIIIDNEDLELGDNEKNIRVRILDKNNRKYLNIIAESNYKGLKSKVTSSITIINEVFEIEKPKLDVNSIEAKYRDKLSRLLQQISNEININSSNGSQNIYGAEFSSFNDIVLYKRDDGSFEINSYRETMKEPFVERFPKKEVFISVKDFEGGTNFFIGNPEKSNKKIKLSGVIYVEGNIIISSNFEFNGIIIAKDGEIIINDNIDVDIIGMLITDNVINNDFMEKVNIKYYRHFIYKYGTYLPGFIEPIIDVIKSN